MRTWKKMVPALLLILVSAPSLLQAADPEITPSRDEWKNLLQKVDKLQSDLTNSNLRATRSSDDLKAIRDDLSKIRRLLEILAEQQGVIQRQSGYDPRSVAPGAPGVALPATGSITLQNVYPAAATVRINDQSYFIEANRTRIVPNFPVGPFQYSVDVEGYGIVLPPKTETLHSTGFRITIFPRMP